MLIEDFELFQRGLPESRNLALELDKHCLKIHKTHLKPPGKRGWIIREHNYVAIGTVNSRETGVMVNLYGNQRHYHGTVTAEEARKLELYSPRENEMRFWISEEAQLPAAFRLVDRAWALKQERLRVKEERRTRK